MNHFEIMFDPTLEIKIQNFIDSLDAIEIGLKDVHLCQKRVAEQTRSPIENDERKVSLQSTTISVYQALHEQRVELEVLEQSIATNLTSSKSSSSSSSTGPFSHPSSTQTQFSSLRGNYFTLLSEFHDLLQHDAQQQRRRVVNELFQTLPLEIHEWEFISSFDTGFFSHLKSILDTSVHPLLEVVTLKYQDLNELEKMMNEIKELMSQVNVSPLNHQEIINSNGLVSLSPTRSSIHSDLSSLHTLVEIDPNQKETNSLCSYPCTPSWKRCISKKTRWGILFFLILLVILAFTIHYGLSWLKHEN